jgi:hypothetical protein
MPSMCSASGAGRVAGARPIKGGRDGNRKIRLPSRSVRCRIRHQSAAAGMNQRTFRELPRAAKKIQRRQHCRDWHFQSRAQACAITKDQRLTRSLKSEWHSASPSEYRSRSDRTTEITPRVRTQIAHSGSKPQRRLGHGNPCFCTGAVMLLIGAS